MEKFDKITKIKVSVFFIYFVSFFLPIYSQVIWGSEFKVSISELGAGTFFVVFFFVLITAIVIMEFINKQYVNYIYLFTVGSMFLLLLTLLFLKDSVSTLRFTWYFHFILIGVLVFAHFNESLTLKFFDKIILYTKKYASKVMKYIKQKNEIRKENKLSKNLIIQDDVLNEEGRV